MLALGLLLGAAFAQAQIAVTNKISDVRGTKHNLSASDTYVRNGVTLNAPARTVKATSETQVCVFCHTPHGATAGIVAPLWNRALSGALYPNVANPTYSSSSIEASAAELATGPGGSSKLCLSCHDGTMAIDKVNVLNGVTGVTIAMTGLTGAAGSAKLPTTGNTTGFTRNLGTNLSNDHPISFAYDSIVAGRDGELRTPAPENTTGGVVMNRAPGKAKPVLPLEAGQIQCATCHDPHLRDNNTTNGNAKFLRANRFQVTQPSGGLFNQTNDTICLACHDKGGAAWAFSAHANSNVATQTYKGAAATQREFPLNGVNGPPVWQVACLNCHDTHTVQGARRLLREGTDSPLSPKDGGNPALEETCYQCHQISAGSAVNNTALTANAVPDIKTDFALAFRMPIKTVATEVHDVGGVFNDSANANCSNTGGTGNCGKDLLESRVKLGSTDLTNRHAECSDCHNPHRVIKGQSGLPGSLTVANTNEKAGTHKHEDAAGYTHSNVISGVLRGSWGVEPVYPNNSFQSLPTAASFAVKRGDPVSAGPIITSRPGAESYVTREYQICLKCHSNYAYPDDNIYPNSANRPQLGGSGMTAQNANGHTNFTSYTNQAKEFQAPTSHAQQVGTVSLGTDGGAANVAARNTNNHRSWHPVMGATGRTTRPANGFLAPWSNAIGTQTMYCSDCHGSATATATVIPVGNTVGTTATSENGSAWGPHGSSNNFLLKGDYSTDTGEGQEATGLCFKCHKYANYATDATVGNNGATGFNTDKGDGHALHSNKIGTAMKCNWCHVSVPHGWKNRGLLVNLNDVGPEAGLALGTSVASTQNVGYTNGPYYRRAFLRVTSFPSGTNWTDTDCNGGRDGMRNACDSPP